MRENKGAAKSDKVNKVENLFAVKIVNNVSKTAMHTSHTQNIF